MGQVMGLSDCNEKCMKCVICEPLVTMWRSAQVQCLFHSRLWNRLGLGSMDCV